MLGGVATVQFGAAFAKSLFDDVGAGGAVLLRVATAAAVLGLLLRPRIAGYTRRDLGLAVLFGLSLAGMNLSFYTALDRIPLGVAVTFEFVGPLGVAVLGSRRGLDLVWAGIAAAGIVLLSDFGGGDLDGAGVAFALLAGVFWAAYILINAQVGQAFPGGDGLALAMIVAVLPLLPFGIAQGGGDLLLPSILAVGLAAGVLSSAIPYALELEALRRLPTGVFGVLMSLEPAVAALVGFAVLGQDLVAREVAAILLVVVASAGAARGADFAARDA